MGSPSLPSSSSSCSRARSGLATISRFPHHRPPSRLGFNLFLTNLADPPTSLSLYYQNHLRSSSARARLRVCDHPRFIYKREEKKSLFDLKLTLLPEKKTRMFESFVFI